MARTRATRRRARRKPARSLNAYNIFVKEDSPYHLCPENIRCLFKILEEDQQIELQSFKNHFPEKKGPTNFCTKRVDTNRGEKAFTCETCSKDSSLAIVYCQACFVKEQHEGHQIEDYDDDGMCDCGRDWLMKESLCERHGKHEDVEIRAEDRKEFLEFFGWLWTIVFYLSEALANSKLESTLKQNLFSTLEGLAQGSPYYISLISDLIMMPLQFIPSKEEPEKEPKAEPKMILKFFFDQDMGLRLIEHLTGEDNFRLSFIKELQKWKQSTGNSTPYEFNTLETEIINNGQILKILGADNFFVSHMGHQYVQFAKKGEEGSQTLLSNFVNFQCEKKQDNNEYVNFLVENFTSREPKAYEESVVIFMIEKALAYLEERRIQERNERNEEEEEQQEEQNQQGEQANDEQVQQQGLDQENGEQEQQGQNEEQQEQQQNGEQQEQQQELEQQNGEQADGSNEEQKDEEQMENQEKDSSESEECSSQEYTLRKVVTFLTEKLFDILRQRIQNPSEVASYLKEKDLPMSKLKTYLKYAITNISEFYESQQQFFLLLILISLTEDTKLIKRLWRKMMDQDTYFVDAIDRIYQILSIIGLWDAIRWRLKNQYKEENQQEIKIQQMKNWWKCYLCEGKEYGQSDLIRLKQNFLSFPEAGQILNKLCKYNEEQGIFQYNSQQKYNNPLQQFPYRQYMGEFRNLYRLQVSWGQPYTVPDSCQFQFEVLEKIFVHDYFLRTLKRIWSSSIRNIEGDQYELENAQQKRIGYLYVLILVIIDNFLHGKNESIREEIQSLRNSSEERFKYEYLAGQGGSLDKVLGIEAKDKKQKEDEQKLKMILEKGEAKKKKLQQKFQKNNTEMISRLLSKTKSLHIQGEDDLCIVCHEKGKETNPLFYLGFLKKGKIPSSVIHSKNNKAQTLISTCFHLMHFECFRKTEKSDNKQFTCPLCSKITNCILPLNLQQKDERYSQAWQNLLIGIAILGNSQFWFGGAFGLLFQHCIESHGLNPIACISKYKEQKFFRMRANNYIFELLLAVFLKSQGQIRDHYNKTMNNLYEQIKSISSTLVGKVQRILWKVITDKLNENEIIIDPNQIRQLQEKMVPEQFGVLHENLQNISEQTIEVSQDIKPHNPETLALKIFHLPQNSTQLKQLPFQPNCQGCETGKKQTICLLCLKTFCGNCYYTNHEHMQVHSGKYLMFEKRSGRLIYFQNENNWTHHDIYFNYFRERYYNSSEEERNKEIFFLDKQKYEKILTDFMAN